MSNEFEEDFIIDDIFTKKTKKIDGKKKGNRTELQLTKVLSSRFGLAFSRTVSSGARWSQTNLSEEAKNIFSGDLVVCKGFKYCIESKGGYDSIDINSAFLNGNKEIDLFLEQVTNDSNRCGRKPMLCWKKTRKPWLVFIHSKELSNFTFEYLLTYNKWSAIALDHLLKLEDKFFIE